MKPAFSDLEHSIIALVIAAVSFFAGFPEVGAAFSIGLFAGREHAQAEYRWIETFGSHRRAFMPWWGGFDRRVWDVHSGWWNLLLPWIASALSAVFYADYLGGLHA